jgi:UDP-N-acetylmuramate: L-alanyl-gamma-D-glutamyl-meso-diaminopimelate ligase
MKRGAMNARLADSLSGADRVFCFSAGLGWNAAQTLAGLGARATTHNELDALIKAVVTYARAGDQVVVMSNGGFGGIHGKLLAQLADAGLDSQTPGVSARSVDSTSSAA